MADPLDKRLRQEIEVYIIDHADDPKFTVHSTALAFDVSEWTISDIRRFLRESGRISDFPRTREKHKVEGRSKKGDGDKKLKEMIAKILDGEETPEVTAVQRKQILDQTMIHGSIDQKQKAIKEREAMDRQSGTVQEVGPGEPLTEDDWVRELSLLLEASGLPIAEKAWKLAFINEKNILIDLRLPTTTPHTGGVSQEEESKESLLFTVGTDDTSTLPKIVLQDPEELNAPKER